MKIFIDDIRTAPSKYDLTFTTGEAFLKYIKKNNIYDFDLISLDHDLGEDVMSGYDLVKKLVELNVQSKNWQFHTDNFVGLKNMALYLKSAENHGILKTDFINPYKISVIDGIEKKTFLKTPDF